MNMAHLIGWVLIGLAWAGIAYTVLAAWFVGRFGRGAAAKPAPYPPVTLLKPLYGAPPGLEADLEGFFVQDYPAPMQIVFGVCSKRDAAIAIVERLCDRYPAVDAVLTVNPASHGFNPKISNLINMAEEIRYGIVIVSDDDIAVPKDYARRLAEALAPDPVGAVSCLYTGVARGGVGARLCAMSVDYQFLPNAATGLGLGLAHPCMGSTIAIKGTVLETIGGFAAVADHLADDYEIGRKVRRTGLRVVVPALAVRHACTEDGISDWFNHELRWARTIRINDPAGHWGSIVTHPLPLALLATALTGLSVSGIGTLAATLVARAVLKWRVDRRFGSDGGPHWLLPARDCLAFAAFLLSLFGGRVRWRGESLRVRRNGILTKD